MALNFFQSITFSFAGLFPVLNPIGSSFLILSILPGATPQTLNHLAYKIALYSAIMLLVAMITGTWILKIFGITIPIVLIGGGIILAYIGWDLLNQPIKSKTEAMSEASKNMDDVGSMIFYPLTMPVTAGPGCIAVVIAIGAHSVNQTISATLLSQLGNAIGILLVCFTIYICYRYCHAIANKMGEAGTTIIMKLAAFFNLCIGLELIWHGIQYLIK